MTADLLRRAATLIRERAEAATPGPWLPREQSGAYVEADVQNARGACVVDDGSTGFADGRHIAAWHPAVALAVADWLEAEAEAHRADLVGPFPSACCRMGHALAVARTYLGEAS